MSDTLNKTYVLDKVIGSGSYGSVYKAHHINDKNKLYAIKQINKKKITDYLEKALKTEIHIMKLMSHENSVNLFDVYETDSDYNLIMELCDSDLDIELNEHFNKYHKGFSELELWMIMNQFNKIFLKMRKENVIHRDLKLKNIMIKRDENVEIIGFIIKLGDFGFSKVLKEEDLTSTILGTPATKAPEIWLNYDYTVKVDLWSIGVIIYQLLFHSLPFSSTTRTNLSREIKSWKAVKFPEKNELTEICKDLINKLMKKEPNERIEFEDYFKHKFFSEEHKKYLLKKKKEKEESTEEIIEITDFDKKFEKIIPIKKYEGYILYKGKDLLNNKYVYIKEISRSLIDGNDKNKKIFENEIKLLSKLKGNKFPSFVGLSKTDSFYYIIMEYFSGKMLSDFTSNKLFFDDSFKNAIYEQLSPIISEIKDKNIQLGPRNFAFSFYENRNNFEIKFFDYGLSSIFSDNKEKINFYKLEDFQNFNSEENINKINSERKEPIIKDEDIENIFEIVKNKVNFIYDYFNKLIEDKNNYVNDEIYSCYYKEIIIFLYFCYLECQTIINFIKINGDFDIDKVDEANQVIHLINMDENIKNKKYDYSKINFIEQSSNNIYVYNRENPTFEYYLKIFIYLKNKINDLYIKLEEDNKIFLSNENASTDEEKDNETIFISKSEIDRMDNNSFNDKMILSNRYFNNCLKEGNLDKLFKKIFENILTLYSLGKKNNFYDDLYISKYLLEYIIFLRAILGEIKITKDFFLIIDNIKENKLTPFISFIGEKIKQIKEEGIFDYNINPNNYCNLSDIQLKEEFNKDFDKIIIFYKKIIKLIDTTKKNNK